MAMEPDGLLPDEVLAIGPLTLADEVGEYVYTAAVVLDGPAAGVMGPEFDELEPAPAPLEEVWEGEVVELVILLVDAPIVTVDDQLRVTVE